MAAPPMLKTELLDHQKRVIERIKQQPGLVVAHGTGSGKTLSSIGAIVDLSPTQARVIVPASLKENYLKEVRKHVKGKLPIEVESLQKAVREGRPPRGDMLIVDEAHRVRNPETKGYQLLGQSPAGKRLLMTASPVYNKPEDVAPLVNLAAGKRELPVGTEFERRYVQKPDKGLLAIINPFAETEPKIVRKEELGRVLNKWVDYHGGNEKGFPALEEKRIDVPMTERQARLHANAWGELPMMTKLRLVRGLPPAKEDLPAINQFQAQTRQLSSSERKYSTEPPELTPKIRTAVDNLQGRIKKNPEHKAVVYANYLGTLDDYAEELDKRKIPYAAFRGDSPKKIREQAVRDLNAGKVKTLLVSGAGGEGLDLKGVRQVQVLEPHWNDEKLRQVIGRARRYGSHDHLPPKDRKVEVERYAAHMEGFLGRKRPGVEGMLYDMSEQKQRLNRQVLDLMAKQGEDLYHGSPQRLGRIEPRAEHGDPKVPPAVFASPSRSFALTYASRPWSDRDFRQSTQVKGGVRKIVMREMRPGALEDTFQGARGYLHTLPGQSFEKTPRHRAAWEQISTKAVQPTKVEKVKDTLKALQQDPNVRLERYDPAHPDTRKGVKRAISRMNEMDDGGKEYLKWRLQGAPSEIKQLFQEELQKQGAEDDQRDRGVSELGVLPRVRGVVSAPLSGIPDRGRMDRLPSVPETDRNVRMGLSISRHPAARRGDHLDLRLVEPGRKQVRAHSWALPAELPAPGKNVAAIAQPTHTAEYAMREKPFAIETGYGQTRPGEKVTPVSVGQAEVVESSPDKVRFLRHRSSGTDEFVLRRLEGEKWRLHNATKNRNTVEGSRIPDYKRNYAQIDPGNINVHDANQVVTAKIDGASVLVDLQGPDRFNRVYSYRRPVSGETGLIEHTFKDSKFNTQRSDPDLKGTLLRGELYFADRKTGKALPSSQVAGLLNSGVEKSRAKQRELGVEPRIAVFDVVRHRGQQFENKPFVEKIDVLERAAKGNNNLEMPPIAVSPESKAKLIHEVQSGKRPETREGLVVRDLFKPGDVPAKAVFRPDHDVFIREVIPEKSQRGMVGAVRYSHTPDGPIVGKIGTGFNHPLKKKMLKEPEKFVGRVAVVRSQSEQGAAGALRAPSFQHWHPDKNDPELFKEATAEEELERQAKLLREQVKKLPRIRSIFARKAQGAIGQIASRVGEVVGVSS